MAHPTCSVPGCEKPARSSSAEWCPMHYHRWYRHGSVDRVASREPSIATGRKYRERWQPDHPLAMRNGKVYVHRVVLFDKIGPGPHRCNWCDAMVDWTPSGDVVALVVDHLNNVTDDNRPENLVPSCLPCNTIRGSQRKSTALRSAGWWSSHDTIGTRMPPLSSNH